MSENRIEASRSRLDPGNPYAEPDKGRTPTTPETALGNRSHSHACLLWVHVEVPVDATVLAVTLLKPFIAFGEVTTIELHPVSTSSTQHQQNTYESSHGTQRTRMYTLQNKVLVDRNANHPLLRRRAPCQEHDAVRAHLRDGINHLLCEKLPAFALVRVGLALTNRQTCVEEQDATISPGCE
jgi:hypothetical protein